MSTSAVSPASRSVVARKQRSVLLVFCCTILGAAAQILMKMGANQMTHPAGAHGGLVGILTNIPLLTGYALYGMSTLLLVLALKDGELSLLYPVIALTYVWVTVLSFAIFHDAVNAFRLIGIAIIVAGVAIIGKASQA